MKSPGYIKNEHNLISVEIRLTFCLFSGKNSCVFSVDKVCFRSRFFVNAL